MKFLSGYTTLKLLLKLEESYGDCFTDPNCVVRIVDRVLNNTQSVPASILFVLADSDNVGLDNFVKSKEFVKDIVNAYP